MVAGFLTELRKLSNRPSLSCCTPFDRAALTTRFPEIEWLAYNDANRESAIRSCDVWLGLGGSPFQIRVSRWFIDHLMAERYWCNRYNRPSYFLGIGGQELLAFEDSDLRSVFERAQRVWMRDAWSLPAMKKFMPSERISPGADLAHLVLQSHSSTAAPGRIVVTLNFDFQSWSSLPVALDAIGKINPAERVWFSQESRPLDGSEQSIWSQLPQSETRNWEPQVADNGSPSAEAILKNWPTGEWLISSRFHACLVAMWAGSKIVVVGTNDKLRGLAEDFDLPIVDPNASSNEWNQAIASAKPVSRNRLNAAARDAKRACAEFFASI